MATQTMLKKAYGNCEGPLGFPMKDFLAKELETLMNGLPQECKDYGFKRVSVTPKKLDFDEEARTDVSVVTNEAIDRDNEVIISSGLNWKQFQKGGGAVMWAHDYSMLPVGRSQWIIPIKAGEKAKSKTIGWKAQTFYHTRPKAWEGQWLPDGVVSEIAEGGLRGKSIGFLPSEFSSPKPDEIKARPELAEVNFVIRKAIVIEYSVAPVPSNYEAIVGGKGFKHFTQKSLEHLCIYLPSAPDDFYKIPESSCVSEVKKYKVITQTSVSERLLKALKGR